jgi:hypothetical protein
MDRPRKMEVADWRDSPPLVIVKERARRRFLSPTLIGIFATLLLHVLVIQSLPFGSSGPKLRPPETPESTDALSGSKTDSAEGLVLISLPTMSISNQAAAQTVVSSLLKLRKLKIKSPVVVDLPSVLNIEVLALGADEVSKPTSDSGDGVELARLSGIYTGQIEARIARVWRRPRTPINEDSKKPTDADESFQCEAQIVQDARGNVQEILLPRCNGSAVWQRSLVSAIQQASPLPAPPNIKVFTQSITLNFVGLPYIQGASNEEYEIVPLARVDQ